MEEEEEEEECWPLLAFREGDRTEEVPSAATRCERTADARDSGSFPIIGAT